MDPNRDKLGKFVFSFGSTASLGTDLSCDQGIFTCYLIKLEFCVCVCVCKYGCLKRQQMDSVCQLVLVNCNSVGNYTMYFTSYICYIRFQCISIKIVLVFSKDFRICVMSLFSFLIVLWAFSVCLSFSILPELFYFISLFFFCKINFWFC